MTYSYNESFINEIIAMAWADEISFEAIQESTGLLEKEVIVIMRKSLKPRSFAIWRKRVSGRKLKHLKKASFFYQIHNYD
ncbi:MAG: TIGR03643 family protein [Caedibacter sp. 38-128]|nr:MAG: TIGR03643 family protein [Caedibacter sp. 38-128]